MRRRSLMIALLPFLVGASTAWRALGTTPARIGWLKIQGRQHMDWHHIERHFGYRTHNPILSAVAIIVI